jgi:hypothetical protein
MNAAALKPQCLDSFKQEIKPLKGAPDTPDNRRTAAQTIQHYAARLQMLDLNLSEGQAREILATVYRTA